MLKQFKAKKFAREAKYIKLANKDLILAAESFINLTAAGQQRLSLGGGLYKIRIATKKGKSSGARSILAYKEGNKLFWLHIFSKSDKENITQPELKRLKLVSNILLNLSKNEMKELINLGEIEEVISDA